MRDSSDRTAATRQKKARRPVPVAGTVLRPPGRFGAFAQIGGNGDEPRLRFRNKIGGVQRPDTQRGVLLVVFVGPALTLTRGREAFAVPAEGDGLYLPSVLKARQL